MSDVTEKTITKNLTFSLTEAGFVEKGKLAGKNSKELRDLQREFEDVKKKYKSQIELKQGELDYVHSVIRAGKETRMVVCIERKDFSKNIVEYVFGGEIIEERTMQEHERQLQLKESA